MLRAAHFLRNASLIGTPPTDAIISTYLELGARVDVFANDWNSGVEGNGRFGEAITRKVFSYGKKWLLTNIPRIALNGYHIVSANAEDPVAVAGIVSRLNGAKLVVSADEIFSGSYLGNANFRWKRLCKAAMRRAALTIVNDPSRVSLQRDYAELSTKANIIVYPGCFRDPPASVSRIELRERWGIPANAFVIVVSGHVGHLTYMHWLINNLKALPEDVHLLVQPGKLDEFAASLYQLSPRIHVVPEQMSCRYTWSTMQAADAGFVGYAHDGPQFQNMGVSATRLCMFLQNGLPVMAVDQESFRFIHNSCGQVIRKPDDIIQAVATIRQRYSEFSKGALLACENVIMPRSRYLLLQSAIKDLVEG